MIPLNEVQEERNLITVIEIRMMVAFGHCLDRCPRELSGVMNMFSVLIWAMIIQMYTSVRTLQTLYLRSA